MARKDAVGLYWRQANPVTGDEVETDAQGQVAAKVTVDPAGVAVGDSDPFAQPAGDSGGEGERVTQAQMNARYAQLLPPSLGGNALQVNLDGFQVNASFALNLVSLGAASVRATSQAALPIYSRSRQTYVGLAVYNAQAAANGIAFLGQGSLGYLPAGTTYEQGVGLHFQGWFTSVYPGTSNNFLSEKYVQVASYLRQVQDPSQDPSSYAGLAMITPRTPEGLKADTVKNHGQQFYDCVKKFLQAYINKQKGAARTALINRLNNLKPFSLNNVVIDFSMTSKEIIEKYHPGIISGGMVEYVSPDRIGGLLTREEMRLFFLRNTPRMCGIGYTSKAARKTRRGREPCSQIAFFMRAVI